MAIYISKKKGNPKPVLQEKTVKPETTPVEVLPDEDYDALSKVSVEAIKLQEKPATPQMTPLVVEPDEGYDGLSKVNVAAIALNLQEKTATAGSSQVVVTPDSGYNGLSKVKINPINNQSKTVRATTSNQTVTPDSGYSGLGDVTIMPQIHSGTYTVNVPGTHNMGQNHNYRYVDTSNMIEEPEGIFSVTANGTYDFLDPPGSTVPRRYIEVDVASGDTPVPRTTLWVNSSPTDSFADQTITLSQTKDMFEYIAIYYYYSKSTTDYEYCDLFESENLLTGSTLKRTIGTCITNGTARARYFSIGSDGKTIKFSKCFALITTSQSASETMIIPTRIVGIGEGSIGELD